METETVAFICFAEFMQKCELFITGQYNGCAVSFNSFFSNELMNLTRFCTCETRWLIYNFVYGIMANILPREGT